MEDIRRFLAVRSAYLPTFSSNGQIMAYITDISGVPELWALRLGEPFPDQVSYFGERVGLAKYAPQGDHLVFAMDAGGNERWQLYLRHQGRILPLTRNPEAIHEFGAWAPDGQLLAISANTRNPAYFDVYIGTLEGEWRRVWQADATLYVQDWSADGRYLLVAEYHAPSAQDLWLVDISDRSRRRLTSGPPARYLFAQFGSQGDTDVWALSDLDSEFLRPVRISLETGRLSVPREFDWDVEQLAISWDGCTAALVVNDGGRSRLLAFPLPELDRPAEAHLPLGVVLSLEWHPDESWVAYSFSGPHFNPDIWRWEPEKDISRLTWSPRLWVELTETPEPESWHFESFDGRLIQGWLYRPAPIPPPGGWPALVIVHGGPESQARPDFDPVIAYFVRAGYLVYTPNVRGSTGFGKTFSHLDDRELRPNAVRDLAEGVKALQEAGLASPKATAVMGASYGGFMVLSALTDYPDLWAAGIDIVGIANLETFLENTGPWRRKLREAEYGSLEHDRELLRALSPIHRADRIKAPLLVIHGRNDPRVPVTEAEQIVGRLRELGRPVELLVFDDEGHGVVRLPNKIRMYESVAKFLEKHLKGQQ
ncbi:MAG: S9 family peptidase [Chloroflexota bacterium]